MVEEHLKDIEKLEINRYLQVIIASKYARLVNSRLARERQEEQTEETDAKGEPQPYRRVASEALQALVDGKIEYERPEGDNR